MSCGRALPCWVGAFFVRLKVDGNRGGKADRLQIERYYARREVLVVARAKYAEWLTEQGLERLAEMAPRLTDAEMAKETGISSSTFYEWLKKHPEMSEAVTRARTGADARAVNESVERSLLETALGGVRVLKKPMKIKTTTYDARGRRIDREKIVMAEEEVYIKADVKAQIFWLTNREPERWRNRVEAAIVDDNTVNYVFREATSEEAAGYAD